MTFQKALKQSCHLIKVFLKFECKFEYVYPFLHFWQAIQEYACLIYGTNSEILTNLNEVQIIKEFKKKYKG